MELKEVSIKFAITHNLGDYSNCRPEAYFSGQLEPGDDLAVVAEALQAKAASMVHAAIDAELESRDQAPYYYAGPRFDLLRFSAARIAIIAPAGPRDALPGLWASNAYLMADRRRLPVIRQKAADLASDWILIDCSDGDYSRLPELERFGYFVIDEPEIEDRYLLLTPDSVLKSDLPEESWHGWYVRRYSKLNTRAAFIDEMEARAEADCLTLLPGFTPEDRAALPELKLKAEAVIEEDEELMLEYDAEPGYPDDDDYEDDYDEFE